MNINIIYSVGMLVAVDILFYAVLGHIIESAPSDLLWFYSLLKAIVSPPVPPLVVGALVLMLVADRLEPLSKIVFSFRG